MLLRIISLVAAAGTLAGAVHAPAKPVTFKYRIQEMTEQEVDATAVGQGKQTQKFGTGTFVTLTLDDSAGGRTAHLVLDSITADSAAPIPAEQRAALDSLRGNTLHAFLDPAGKVGASKMLKGPENAVGQLRRLLGTLVPRVQATSKVGDAWTDTTDATADIPSGQMTTRTVVGYKVAANETRQGVNAVRLESQSSSAMSGTQGPSTIDGSGTGTGTHFVTAAGHYLDGNATSTSNLNVTIPQANAPIQVLLRQTTTIALLQ